MEAKECSYQSKARLNIVKSLATHLENLTRAGGAGGGAEHRGRAASGAGQRCRAGGGARWGGEAAGRGGARVGGVRLCAVREGEGRGC